MVGEFLLFTYIFPSTTDLMIFNIGEIIMILLYLPSPEDLAISDIGEIIMILLYLPSPADLVISDIEEMAMIQLILTHHISSSTQSAHSSHKPVNNTDTPSTRHGEISVACAIRSSSKFIWISRTAPHFVHKRWACGSVQAS